MLEINLHVPRRFDQFQTVMDEGQRFEAEEVKFDQADFLDAAHIELSYDPAFFIDEQRKMVDQWQIRQHYARGVGRGMTV